MSNTFKKKAGRGATSRKEFHIDEVDLGEHEVLMIRVAAAKRVRYKNKNTIRTTVSNSESTH